MITYEGFGTVGDPKVFAIMEVLQHVLAVHLA
jgi:hypothetical protein